MHRASFAKPASYMPLQITKDRLSFIATSGLIFGAVPSMIPPFGARSDKVEHRESLIGRNAPLPSTSSTNTNLVLSRAYIPAFLVFQISQTAVMFSLSSLPRPTKTYHTEPYDRILNNHKFNGTGKTVLVTGGASGVGLAISKAFAGTGARVAIVSRSVEQQQKAGVDASMFQGSVTDSERMKEILNELGSVDVLVLNAAVAHRRALPTELTNDEFRRAFEVNVMSSFDILQMYLTMPQPAQKTVINISSALGNIMASHRVGYAASKGAAALMIQSFAAQFKEHKIFSFHPGSFYTPGVAQNIPKNMIQWEDERLPAYFSVWLAGEDSGFLHGRHLWANWDVTELEEMKERIEKDPDVLTIGQVM